MRSRRPTPILYLVRIILYLLMAAILVVNRYRFPWMFTAGTTVLVALAALVGVAGAAYFARRLVRRA